MYDIRHLRGFNRDSLFTARYELDLWNIIHIFVGKGLKFF